jgi:hypothetical protein
MDGVTPDREALAQVVDLRIADLWCELFEIPQERWDVDLIGWFLRTAYGQGYCDALREGERGALCREIADAVIRPDPKVA